jgi:hypothetical protein
VASVRASRQTASGSAGTTPATADQGSSTRSATAVDQERGDSGRRPPAGVTTPGEHGAAARPRGGLTVDLARLGLLGLAAILVAGTYTSYRIWDQGRRDERRPADAIVVMGAAQYDGRPSA